MHHWFIAEFSSNGVFLEIIGHETKRGFDAADATQRFWSVSKHIRQYQMQTSCRLHLALMAPQAVQIRTSNWLRSIRRDILIASNWCWTETYLFKANILISILGKRIIIQLKSRDECKNLSLLALVSRRKQIVGGCSLNLYESMIPWK